MEHKYYWATFNSDTIIVEKNDINSAAMSVNSYFIAGHDKVYFANAPSLGYNLIIGLPVSREI